MFSIETLEYLFVIALSSPQLKLALLMFPLRLGTGEWVERNLSKEVVHGRSSTHWILSIPNEGFDKSAE